MKAKVKSTGEEYNIIEINIPEQRVSVALDQETGRDYMIGEVDIFEVNEIDWERREWDLSLMMLNTSISSILKYQLDAKERGLDVDVEKLQNGITEFISEVTDEFVATYKARLAGNERGGGL